MKWFVAFLLGFTLARAGDALGAKIQKYVDGNCTGLIYNHYKDCMKRQRTLLIAKKILTWMPNEKTPND